MAKGKTFHNNDTETETETEWSDHPGAKDKPAPKTSSKQKKTTTFSPDTQDTPVQKKSSFWPRLFWGNVMLFGFFTIIRAGHFYAACLVIFLNTMMFKEVLSIKRHMEKDRQLPFFYLINWHFFTLALFALYGKGLAERCTHYFPKAQFFEFIYRYHYVIAFLGYVLGVVVFVMSLRKRQYRYQFRQFGWTHLALFLIVLPSSAEVAIIYQGIMWFLYICFLIITNDSWAYFFGILFGRTPLISLSPKKTWEGFIGGMICTYILAFVLIDRLAQFDYLFCPQPSLGIELFADLTCERPAYLFAMHEFATPQFLVSLGLSATFTMSTLQMHSFVLATFASIIAPFGGFFASGLKRAFKVKDFGDIIPGHGGVTDRMDCQMLMGMFCYVWLFQVVYRGASMVIASPEFILEQIALMSQGDQMLVLEELQKRLMG
eukprot:CAMPEP_0114997188 /NCGR_PEP_ID=MMETSP0216-20121206/14757_1 /TAXON_ID=223996 /ORGANISM="Protocruzia adherens, Strain Boccale" /LENGTH=431 /DNA_ID=CAMNT_0002361535 /DNA_START=114 /DNA_END=1409 /DNA_ORIENTATION=-